MRRGFLAAWLLRSWERPRRSAGPKAAWLPGVLIPVVAKVGVVLSLCVATPVLAQTNLGTATSGANGQSGINSDNIFTWIVSQIETPLTTTVTQTVSSLLNWMALPLQSLMVLYIAITGVLVIRGMEEPASVVLSRFLKLALVVWVLTGTANYQQYVYDFFWTTLPNGLQSALGTSGATPAGASAFDTAWKDAFQAGDRVWLNSIGGGWTTILHVDLLPLFGVLLFWVAALLSVAIGFAIYEISRLFLVLSIAVGPLLIPLALFPSHRSIFERWLSTMVSCVLLQILTTIMLSVIMKTETSMLEAMGTGVNTDGVANTHLLIAGIIFFAVAAYVGLHLPQLATAIAGGVHFHVGGIARTIVGRWGNAQIGVDGELHRFGRSGVLGALNVAGRDARDSGRVLGSAGRTVASGSRRLLSPPGNSLSGPPQGG